jgi:hypothetical protein
VALTILHWKIVLKYLPEVVLLTASSNVARLVRLLTHKIATWPRVRTLTIKFAYVITPVCIGLAFAFESSGPIEEMNRATVSFAVSAVLAAIGLFLWEEVRHPNLYPRILIIAGLEAAVILGFYLSISWLRTKQDQAVYREMVDASQNSADRSREYLGTVRQFEAVREALKKPVNAAVPVVATQRAQVIPTSPAAAPPPKKDISLNLVYKSGFALLMVNTGNAVIHQPKFFAVVWDLDREQFQDPLPIPAFSAGPNDFVKPGRGIGPEEAITRSNVKSLVKENDRLVGTIEVDCVDCDSEKWYWVYAIQGKGGWYAEIEKGHAPALNALGRTHPQIKADPYQFFANIPKDQRLPILEMP